MRSLNSTLGIVGAIAPAVLVADNVPAPIDLLNFDSAVIAIQVGVGGIAFSATNKIEFVLTHSDDGTTFTPVGTDDVQDVGLVADGIVLALKAAHAQPSVTRLGYVGNRRYLKLLADFSGTHGTGTPIAATIIKGHSTSRPVAA